MNFEEKKRIMAMLDRQADEEADAKLRAEAEDLVKKEKEQVTAGDEDDEKISEADKKASEADDNLRAQTQEIADAEADIVTERTGEDIEEDTLTQNARANANWPLGASERKHVAAKLLRIAKTLIG